jgi:micrococcal nuclease
MKELPSLSAAILCFTLATPSAAGPAYGPYRASITRVVDGDTVEADLFLYPSLKVTTLVRLKGIDTPEIHGPTSCERALAQRASAYLATLAIGTAQVDEVSPDKFGSRIDGRVLVKGVDLAAAMISSGHGRAYSGGTRRAWCQ